MYFSQEGFFWVIFMLQLTFVTLCDDKKKELPYRECWRLVGRARRLSRHTTGTNYCPASNYSPPNGNIFNPTAPFPSVPDPPSVLKNETIMENTGSFHCLPSFCHAVNSPEPLTPQKTIKWHEKEILLPFATFRRFCVVEVRKTDPTFWRLRRIIS